MLKVRGMKIDEAIKQLSFSPLKGSAIIKDVLLEAQELAVTQHNIEYKSNLWICRRQLFFCFSL
jgi:large subunit ribosomal protein L22